MHLLLLCALWQASVDNDGSCTLADLHLHHSVSCQTFDAMILKDMSQQHIAAKLMLRASLSTVCCKAQIARQVLALCVDCNIPETFTKLLTGGGLLWLPMAAILQGL